MNLWVWLRSEWDRVAGYGFVVAGAVSLFLGYRGMRGTPFLADELTYLLTGGLGGLFCLGLGVGLFISADLRDEWRKLDRIESAIRGDGLPDSTELLRLASLAHQDEEGADRQAKPTAEHIARNGAPAPAHASGYDRGSVTLVVAGGVILVAAAMLGAGWRQAATTGDLGVAGRAVALAAAGLAVALLAIGLWTLRLRYQVTRREARVFGPYLVAQLSSSRRSEPTTTAASFALDTDHVLIAPDLTRYHRPGCPALDSLAAVATPRSDVVGSHAACGICGP